MNHQTIAKIILDRAVKEAVARADPYSIRDISFPSQDKFVNDKSRFVAAQCSRRAGKSNGVGLRLFRKARRYPGSIIPYIALTRESAHNIMWPVFNEINDKYKVGANLTESNLTVTLPNKTRIVCFGADMKNFIKRLRGIKTPEAAVDEGQSFGDHLKELSEDILTPAIADYGDDGAITVTGTPGPVPRGYFYDICSDKAGFNLHKWTLLENPYMPKAKEFLESLKKQKGWDDRNPTYLREWCNQWVIDFDALLIRYNESLNHYENLPHGVYNYILGVDIGHKDADALAVLAWNEASRKIYLVHEIVTREQDITELSNQIQWCMNNYDISKIVMDEGALGKKIAEEIRRRKQLPVQPADKARKMENVAFLNEWLRLGNFKAKKDSHFARDSYHIQIDYEKTTPDRLVVKKGFHSDIVDSVLYGFKESPAYTYEEPKKKAKYGTPEWAVEEVSEIEKAAEDHFAAQSEAEQGFGWDSW